MDESDSRVVDADSLEWTDYDHGERAFRRKQLGRAAGGDALGTSLYVVPPGKRTWPRHYHAGNEEAMYVLEGEGTLALGPGGEDHDLGPGDYAALPAGESGTHEIRAGESGLCFLMVSTMNDPDVTVYPDDRKVGLFAGAAPGGDGSARTLSTFLDLDAEVEYWDD